MSIADGGRARSDGHRTTSPAYATPERGESLPARVIRALLTQRIVLLAVLVVACGGLLHGAGCRPTI